MIRSGRSFFHHSNNSSHPDRKQCHSRICVFKAFVRSLDTCSVLPVALNLASTISSTSFRIGSSISVGGSHASCQTSLSSCWTVTLRASELQANPRRGNGNAARFLKAHFVKRDRVAMVSSSTNASQRPSGLRARESDLVGWVPCCTVGKGARRAHAAKPAGPDPVTRTFRQEPRTACYQYRSL